MNGLPPLKWTSFKRRGPTESSILLQLDSEVNDLRKELSFRTGELNSGSLRGEALRLETEEFERATQALRRKEELSFLLSRVSSEAQQKLLADEGFRQQFSDTKDCAAFVLSVDIRRSTELMLRARSASHFARFLTAVCEDIESVTRQNFGIFDKFTGDGVLAFFPDFFSGPDAGYFVLKAAQQCHAAFRARYKEHRSSFTPVLNDVGLGIGIDHGNVSLLHLPHGLAVVGGAVVYACRLSGAPSGRTYVNQPAFDIVTSRYGDACAAAETALEVKHEGRILCHEVELQAITRQISAPAWMTPPIPKRA